MKKTKQCLTPLPPVTKYTEVDLIVNYAKIPELSFYQNCLYQILSPVELVPLIARIPQQCKDNDALYELSKIIIANHQEDFNEGGFLIKGVRFIECKLLVPIV